MADTSPQTIYFADGKCITAGGFNDRDLNTWAPTALPLAGACTRRAAGGSCCPDSRRIDVRHNGMCNIAYADGHVKSSNGMQETTLNYNDPNSQWDRS